MKAKRVFDPKTSVLMVFSLAILLTFAWPGLSGGIASADNKCKMWGCNDDCEFTTDFRLQDCRGFQSIGFNPYFKLIPGYKLVLESDEERAEITVLQDTKGIDLGDRWIRTRVVEERAYEREVQNGEVEEKLVEISRNWFAICRKTNAVYYFGEDSRDCPAGFDENDVCTGEESNEGSWEAGVNDAQPGLMMPGTPLLGSKYFQEIAPPNGVDRGEIVEMGFTWPLEEDLDAGEEPDFTGCIRIIDTNPAERACGDDDFKIYCPGVGLVQDQDLELVWYGFIGCDDE